MGHSFDSIHQLPVNLPPKAKSRFADWLQGGFLMAIGKTDQL